MCFLNSLQRYDLSYLIVDVISDNVFEKDMGLHKFAVNDLIQDGVFINFIEFIFIRFKI